MLQGVFKTYYLQNRVPNPVNITLTQKQVVDGQWISDDVSEANFKHFSTLLNRRLYGNAHKRFGKKLAMFVVRESDATHRHHLHVVIQRPNHLTVKEFIALLTECWKKTRFGYHQVHFEIPETEDRELGWIDYSLKTRTKADYASSIDWKNSTCFER